jgi:hypothetical protein
VEVTHQDRPYPCALVRVNLEASHTAISTAGAPHPLLRWPCGGDPPRPAIPLRPCPRKPGGQSHRNQYSWSSTSAAEVAEWR